MFISRLIQILDRKCQFNLFDNQMEMFETPGLISCYLPGCMMVLTPFDLQSKQHHHDQASKISPRPVIRHMVANKIES